jgi:hypothetical protein
MQVTQLHTLINAVTQEILGKTGVVQEDLSNVVDIGKAIVDSNNVDNYVKKLVNHIGKVVFANRLYTGGAPSVLMDSWEFGSILQKVSAELPNATENESWALTDGDTYSQDVFYQPKVTAKFFNSRVTFEIPLSFTEKQVKESFSTREQLNGFISLLTTSVENSLTVKIDALIMRTINNMAAETIHAELANADSIKAVNLLALYNAEHTPAIAAAIAMKNPSFIRFATYQLGLAQDRMSKISTLFNVEGKERFTPKDLQKVVLLSDFAKASETFLASATYNAEKVALPAHDAVPYWQGSGTNYAFNDVSKVKVKTSSGAVVDATGILGVLFDRAALGVTNLDRRVTTNYNAKAEFFTNFYKFDAGYFNDLGENFVVFYVED